MKSSWCLEKVKLKSGTAYYIRGRVNGERVCIAAGQNPQTAKELLYQKRDEAVRQAHGLQVESVPIKVAFDEYEVMVRKSRATGTWTRYEWGLNKLMEFFNQDRKLASISKPDILRFRAKIMQAHSVNGMLNIMKYVRAFFYFCLEAGYVQINPARGATKGIKEKMVAVYLDDAQIRHLVASCSDRKIVKKPKVYGDSGEVFQDILRTTLMTGMREEEVANLKISNVRGKLLFITGKGQKERVIPIQSKLWPILDKYIKKAGGEGARSIFEGWSINRIKQYWKRMVARARRHAPAGIDFPKRVRFHDLRHTWASNYLKDGGTLADLQVLLGHSSITTTQRYTHFQKSHLAEKMENMKNEFLEATPPAFRVVS